MSELRGEGWIPIEEAMAIAGRGRTQLNQMAREGKLTRWQERLQKGYPAWFLEWEIRELAESHSRRKRERRVAKREAELENWRDLGYFGQDEATLSCQEAAAMLDISPVTLRAYAAQGRIPAVQEQTGRNGCAYRFSVRLIEAYRDGKKRNKRREQWKKGHLIYGKNELSSENPALVPLAKWITTKQVTWWLGVSESRVHYLRKTGRITAFLQPTGETKPRWYHSKADVEKLLNDPQFMKKRAGWKQAQKTMLIRQVDDLIRLNATTRIEAAPDLRGCW